MHRLTATGGEPGAPYAGRFAPSPTGPLHQGSLVAALASYLDARHHGGRWYVRIEDIDPPREQPGASLAILHSLEAHHLHWDGEVLYQSQRSAAYREALSQLAAQQLSYRCICSRQDLQSAASGEAVYPGYCRHKHYGEDKTAALRLDIEKALHSLGLYELFRFDDRVLGAQQQNLLTEVGDFVIHRKDGLFAYQLAVVVDDIFQGITHVVRGADLLDSTARQMLLFSLLKDADVNLSLPPSFGHVPLLLNRDGQKLSKQNFAAPLDNHTPTQNLFDALHFLGQQAPDALAQETPAALLHWAIGNWKISAARKS